MHEILIVEDNVEFRETFAATLSLRFPDISVSQAKNGIEAFREIWRRPPDLIFMDLRLPGLNGLELTREVKKIHPSITVMVLTHLDSPEYRTAAFQSGADFFLSKESARAEAILSLVERMFS